MRVLGIDPGSSVTGYGIVQSSRGNLAHVAHGNLRLPRELSLPARLARLHALIAEIVELHAPDVAAVEQVFVASSARSALVLGQARGVVLAALAGRGIGVTEYAPSQIKQAVTGAGRANKRQVQTMVRRLLELASSPAADAADALAAAICHAQAGPLGKLGVVTRRRRAAPRGVAVVARRRL